MNYTKTISKKYSLNRANYRSTNKDVVPLLNKVKLKSKVILDFGCGDGSDTEMFLKKGVKRIDGVDISQAMIAIAKQKYHGVKNVTFIKVRGIKLPFKNTSFDFVFSHFVLHYIKDTKKQFKEISRVMKRGATFIAVFNCLTTDIKKINKKVPMLLGRSTKKIKLTILSKAPEEIKIALKEASLKLVTLKPINNPDIKIDPKYHNKDKFKQTTVILVSRK